MENASSATPVDCSASLCCYSWENGTFVLLRTKTWQKLRNGWFKAELTDGTEVSHMGMRRWRKNAGDALEDLVKRVCWRACNRDENRKVEADSEQKAKLIALGKLLESSG